MTNLLCGAAIVLCLLAKVNNDTVLPPVLNKQVLNIIDCGRNQFIKVGEIITLTCIYNATHSENLNIKYLRLEFLPRGKIYPRSLMKSDKNGIFTAPWTKTKPIIFTRISPLYFNVSHSFTVSSTPAQVTYSGEYICEAYADWNLQRIIYKSVCKISVGHAPISVNITVLNSNKQQVQTFDSSDKVIVIRCSAQGSNDKLKISLKSPRSDDHQLLPYNEVVKTGDYHIDIDEPERFDNVTVACIAFNEFGSVSKETSLKVFYETTERLITVNGNTNNRISITSGELLNCSARGNPLPHAEWVAPDEEIFDKTESANLLVVKENSTIKTVQVICKMTQQGRIISKIFSLSIGRKVGPAACPTVPAESMGSFEKENSSYSLNFISHIIVYIVLIISLVVYEIMEFCYGNKKNRCLEITAVVLAALSITPFLVFVFRFQNLTGLFTLLASSLIIAFPMRAHWSRLFLALRNARNTETVEQENINGNVEDKLMNGNQTSSA